ncbi:MAG: PTS ascorbate transporter subunit IIB, partial [Clostridiaceae bacterium]
MKALAVCGFGVGSSMILKMSLEKAFRELGIS